METPRAEGMKMKQVLIKNRAKLLFTFFLLLVEAGLAILFPLFIGYAIDDAIHGQYRGAFQLALLGLASLMVGVGRRIYDSRLYANIYRILGESVISSMNPHQMSQKTARLGMIGELVEFLENSLPELIHNVIGLVGVIIIIATLNPYICLIGIGVTFFIFLIYWITRNKTIKLNKASNDELEKQVDVLNQNDPQVLQLHLRELMKWNINLSDLEAGNFSISWITLIAFLLSAIMIAVGNGIVSYGTLFSLIMYVFQYMENVVNLPLFYQSWLRLKEITGRIEII